MRPCVGAAQQKAVEKTVERGAYPCKMADRRLSWGKNKRKLRCVGGAGWLASVHPRKMGGKLGDFQGVVTLGVAGD
jgi:hypothetical protein